jgi:DNA-directed RNA polymerase subunit RPC12/RpoP
MIKCPACGGVLDRSKIKSTKPLKCPHCGQWVAVKMRTARWMPWVTLALVAVIAFGAGLRGVYLLIAILSGWVPALFVAYTMVGTMFSLELRTVTPEEANAKRLTFREEMRQNREPLELNLTDKKHH